MEKRKCFCDDRRGTDCDYCQGTGYIIESLHLNIRNNKLPDRDEPAQVKHQSLRTQLNIISDILSENHAALIREKEKTKVAQASNKIINKIKTGNDSESHRLMAVAKEFNISKKTLIAFLVYKGFRNIVGTNPKLTERMCQILQSEFGQHRIVKRANGINTVPQKDISLALEKSKIKKSVKKTNPHEVETVTQKQDDVKVSNLSNYITAINVEYD
jgi:hypothetical protein